MPSDNVGIPITCSHPNMQTTQQDYAVSINMQTTQEKTYATHDSTVSGKAKYNVSIILK